MSTVCLPVCCCGAPLLKMIGINGISDSHPECNICKESCLEVASVGIETLDRSSAFVGCCKMARTISRNRSGQSLAAKIKSALFYATP